MNPPSSPRQTQGVILMVLAMLSIPLVDGLALAFGRSDASTLAPLGPQ